MGPRKSYLVSSHPLYPVLSCPALSCLSLFWLLRTAGQINTVEAEDISVENGVDALPTIQFYRDKKMIGEFKGSDIAAVDKVIRSYVHKAST